MSEIPPPKGLTPEERSDIARSLEHIFVTGSYNRHQSWRRSEFKRQKLSGDVEDDDEPSSVAWKPVHLEDIRMNSDPDRNATAAEKKPWPEARGPNQARVSKKTHDVNWFLEYGDDVDPKEFQKRLSGIVPVGCKIEESVVEKAQPQENFVPTFWTDGTSGLSSHLLNRCWRRAVNTAARTIPVPAPEGQPTPEWRPNHKETVQKCRSLGIQGPEDSMDWECPVCGASRIYHRDRLIHYYGSRDIRGCVWFLIRAKQRQLVREALEAQVWVYRDMIVKGVFEASEVPKDGETHDWQYIMSKLQNGGSDPISDNNVLHPDLDVAALRTTENRLIQRYARVPR